MAENSQPSTKDHINYLKEAVGQHSQALDVVMLRDNQQQQIIDQYRGDIYVQQLRVDLLIKMLEERGIFAKEEFSKRWPIYLRNDIGVIGEDGLMPGSLKVTFYGEKN